MDLDTQKEVGRNMLLPEQDPTEPKAWLFLTQYTAASRLKDLIRSTHYLQGD